MLTFCDHQDVDGVPTCPVCGHRWLAHDGETKRLCRPGRDYVRTLDAAGTKKVDATACIHRGEVIDNAKCTCPSKAFTPVRRCKAGGFCADRKVKWEAMVRVCSGDCGDYARKVTAPRS